MIKTFSIFPVIICLLFSGNCYLRKSLEPSVEFSLIPSADPGGTTRLEPIKGRVINSQPEYKIVLYARSGIWFVQPFTEQPETPIKTDATWESPTHLGTEYAALLVTPEYVPPDKMANLPETGNGIIALTVVKGTPTFWQSGWFKLIALLIAGFLLFYFYRLKFQQLSREMNVRFEERLAERTRIARELHDSLLQGFVGISMQINVAADQLPDDSPAKPQLDHIMTTIERVIGEGRNTVQGLRSSDKESLIDFRQRFSQIRRDLDGEEKINFQFIEKGLPKTINPAIADEVFFISREALTNAFRHSGADHISVELEYNPKKFRLAVLDDGRGIDPEILDAGRAGHWGISGMRERAGKIGATLKISSLLKNGTRIELSMPNQIAFSQSVKTGVFNRLSGFYPRRKRIIKLKKKENK